MKKQSHSSLATKFALTYAALFLGVMLLLAVTIRHTVSEQFNRQYRETVDKSLANIQAALAARSELIRKQVQGFAEILREDREFRYRVLFEPNFRLDGYILDYAPSFMPTMGLDVLEIIDEAGKVVSSGHARQSFGRDVQSLVRYHEMSTVPALLANFSAQSGEMTCLTVLDSVQFGAKKFRLLAGAAINEGFLEQLRQNDDEILLLILPEKTIGESENVTELENLEDAVLGQQIFVAPPEIDADFTAGHFAMPTVSDGLLAEARWLFLYPKSSLQQILGVFNDSVSFIFGGGIVLVILLSIWRARIITKPLRLLSESAGKISLENPKIDFHINRDDEVGVLASSLERMIWRLQRDKRELLSAEQKAAYAEVARQVNHDIKNGFLPIKNVMNHWRETAQETPAELPKIFKERESTVAESIEYLERLAKDYAQMRQTFKREPIRVRTVVEALLENYQEFPEKKIQFIKNFSGSDAKIVGDAVQLRRAFENVLRNSIEAIEDSGTVTVEVTEGDKNVFVSWQDNGVGMSQDLQEQLFYTRLTTKPDGTGLGLSNVRRIIEEMGGSVSLESLEGEGTTVTMKFLKNQTVL